MSRSSLLRVSDIREIYRLIGDCRDLGNDPLLWHGRMLEGLTRLVGATVGTGGEGRWRRPIESPSPKSGFSVGLDALGRERLTAYARVRGLAVDPVYLALRHIPGLLVVRTRSQLLTDAEWYRSRTYNEYFKPIQLDHQLTSVHAASGDHTVSVVSLFRCRGERDFSEHEQQLLRFFHAELGRLIGNALASVFDADGSRLSRRQSETLACLLEGASEKQVAARLGISQLTAHQYVTSLYSRFSVHSRAELLAHFLQRRRPAGGRDAVSYPVR
jgi:DNA-binding CsgD family transcriptional regulator